MNRFDRDTVYIIVKPTINFTLGEVTREIRRNTLSIRRNTQAKTPLSKTPHQRGSVWDYYSLENVNMSSGFTIKTNLCTEILHNLKKSVCEFENKKAVYT